MPPPTLLSPGKIESLRQLHPHLRHVELTEKRKAHLRQIGAGILRMARFQEILLGVYPHGVFELAEKLDDAMYIIRAVNMHLFFFQPCGFYYDQYRTPRRVCIDYYAAI